MPKAAEDRPPGEAGEFRRDTSPGDHQAPPVPPDAEGLLQIQRDLAVALHRAESSAEMLELCFKAAIEASGMDCGGIYLVDVASGDLDLIYQQGLSTEMLQLVSHYGADTDNTRLVMAGTPVYSNFGEMPPPLASVGKREGLRAIAVLPIMEKREHQVIGALNLSSHSCELVSEQIRSTLEAITYQIGDAIANKLAQEALQQSEARFRALVEATSDWVWEVDRQDRYTYVSPKVMDHLGYEPAEILGRTPFDFMPPNEAERIGAAFVEIKRAAQPFHLLENICLHKDGSQVVIQTSGTPTFDEYGVLIGYRGIDRNITEHRAAEAQRRRLEQQVQEAQKLEYLGVLAGGVAHDFNNLLVGIIGNAELTQRALPPDHPVRSYVRNIETAAERAADLSNQMLAYSGKGKFTIDRINLQSLIEEMTSLLEVSISSKVLIEYDFAPDVPHIEGDSTQIRQIIMNLIINASEAFVDQAGTLRLRTGLMECDRSILDEIPLYGDVREGHYSYIEVIDEGCGMDQETLDKMFDPFFTTKVTGRGLGLAAVLGIVRSHHGLIQVESRPGRGTRVRVIFPAASPPTGRLAEPGESQPEISFAGMTALLVDDEECVRTVGRSMLEELGLGVATAGSGPQAVELLRDDPGCFDFIILDLTMPQMDGEQTLLALREVRDDLCVILSSGYDRYELTARFSEHSISGFVQKPYRLDTLRAALVAAYEGSA